jgi:PAS domain S-box-containing protein
MRKSKRDESNEQDEHRALRERISELEILNAQLQSVDEETRDLALAMKHSSELVNMSTLDGIMTFLNEAGGRMLGIDPGEVTGTNIMQVIPDHLTELVEDDLIPTLMRGDTWEGDLQYRNLKTGKLTDVHAVTFTVNNPSTGEPQFLANISQDVTERRQVEENLRNSEERLRVLFEEAPDAYYLCDLKGYFVDGNKAAEEVTGYGREELVGKSFLKLNLLSPSQMAKAAAILARNALGKASGPDELILNRRDGTRIPVEIRTNPVKISGRTLILGLARDISQRQLAEEETRQKVAELAAINEIGLAVGANIGLDAVLMTIYQQVSKLMDTQDFRIRLFDPDTHALRSAFKMKKGQRQEPSLKRPAVHGRSEFVVRTGKPLLLRNMTPEKYHDMGIPTQSPVPSFAGVPIISSGKVIGVLSVRNWERGEAHSEKHLDVLTAVASQAAASIENARLFEQAQREIADRIRAEKEKLAIEVQLRRSQKLESIGTLASGVAHEVNNPLTGVINYAELLKDRVTADERATEFAEAIISEGNRIATIVRNLLSFARQDESDYSPARIIDIVTDSLSLLHAVLLKNLIDVQLDVPESLPKVNCRSQQIQQVLVNLITNAQSSLNERYPEYDENKILSISAFAYDDEGMWLRITVEDNGTGIPEELRSRIFDPFFTSKSRDQGTGLGLAVSHGIVTEHHGNISMESSEGEYTRFHVDLPLQQPESPSVEP